MTFEIIEKYFEYLNDDRIKSSSLKCINSVFFITIHYEYKRYAHPKTFNDEETFKITELNTIWSEIQNFLNNPSPIYKDFYII